jgi:hypothetical protein
MESLMNLNRAIGCLMRSMFVLNVIAAVASAADTPLWRLGAVDGNSAEFADFGTAAAAVDVPADWKTRTDWKLLPKGLKGDVRPAIDIGYDLPAVPANGVMFSFKLLHAYKGGAEMTVLSNGVMAGMIQLWGTAGTNSTWPWRKTYRLYVPKELLTAGRNVLRLEAARPLWSDAGVDKFMWWQWDYLQLDALAAPAGEPIHGKMTWLGTTMKHGANDFLVNDHTLRVTGPTLRWMGIAYSGNTIRADFWYDVGSQQPRRMEYLQLLRGLNMSVLVDHISSGHFRSDTTGALPQPTRDAMDEFFRKYGTLFQYYEISNEPGMFGGDWAPTIETARYVNRIKPPHVVTVAPGWAYADRKGSPKGWPTKADCRQAVEALCQATNGHSYGFSYADNRGGSFVENLRTFQGVDDGWPMQYVNTETGANNWHSEANGPGFPSTQPHAQAFDRIMRAHVAVVDRTMQHAAVFDDFGLFRPLAVGADPNTMQAYPGVEAPQAGPASKVGTGTESANSAPIRSQSPFSDTRLKTFRRLALAYATHGTPLPYVPLDRQRTAGRRVYFRAVDTAGIAPLPGSNATADKILLNFVSFETSAQTMRIRVTLPQRGQHVGERIGPGDTLAKARSAVKLSATPEVDLEVQLGAGDAVQYILTPPAERATATAQSSPSPSSGGVACVFAPSGGPLLPETPANLQAQPGDGQVVLTWDPAARAATYVVKRSDRLGGPFRIIADGLTECRYVDKPLTNAARRFYVVAARNTQGASGDSFRDSAAPQAPPPAPADVHALAASGLVVLTWSPVDGATSYSVCRVPADAAGAANAAATSAPAAMAASISVCVPAPAAGGSLGAACVFADTAKDGASFLYTVRAANEAGQSPPSAPAASATPAYADLPEGWKHTDVGAVAHAGSAAWNVANKCFTVRGAGADIWGKADGLHYAYRTLAGDGSLNARVRYFDDTHEWAKIGVMIRASTAPDAAMAIMAVTPGKGCGLTFRTRTGGECDMAGGAGAPWLRLTRQGKTLTGYTSQDGTTWRKFASADLDLPAEAIIGLCVCSHNGGTLNRAVFDRVE